MTTEDQISRNQDERNEARQDLRDTLTEVNEKVARAEDDLRPEHIVKNHPVAAALAATALGFFMGSTVKNPGAGPIMIAVVLGLALATHSSRDAGERDDS